MKYLSTRGSQNNLSYDQVLLQGLANDGGLFVPSSWPKFSIDELQDMSKLDYSELACRIINKFTNDNISLSNLNKICIKTYKNFQGPDIAPLKEIGDNNYILELFNGPTWAFKDYAMQFLANDFERALKSKKQNSLILGATSGDTGSAALQAFSGKENLDIFILFPKGRVSAIQEAQMTSIIETGANAVQIDGDFDDCQEIVKSIFNDIQFREKVNLSAVNSINWARVIPQVVYYFYSAFKLGSPNQKISFSVPTGNFGNIYAGWCAKKMGLPIHRLICASNKNNILSRFFDTGTMKRKIVEPSISPSMDIQVSSNFERLLFEVYDRDSLRVKEDLQKFKLEGVYKIPQDKLSSLKKLFSSYYLDDNGILEEIKRVYNKAKLIIDPHTACGTFAAGKVRLNNNHDKEIPIISLACANPCKFPDAVYKSIGIRPRLPLESKDLISKERHSLDAPADVVAIKSLIESKKRYN
tara:strand:- start:565 stop:1974 length:1410 start_codon:yes stop_codon:yes gene_type:complete